MTRHRRKAVKRLKICEPHLFLLRGPTVPPMREWTSVRHTCLLPFSDEFLVRRTCLVSGFLSVRSDLRTNATPSGKTAQSC
jgi:hypothetical protein